MHPVDADGPRVAGVGAARHSLSAGDELVLQRRLRRRRENHLHSLRRILPLSHRRSVPPDRLTDWTVIGPVTARGQKKLKD